MGEEVNGCVLCGMRPNKDRTLESDDVFNYSVIVGNHLIQLIAGIDHNGTLCLWAEGDWETDKWYPKFCPECGRELSDEHEE